MSRTPRGPEDTRARSGFLIITIARFGGIAMIMLGFAITGKVIDLPWILGAVIAVAGFFEFFFLPRFIARHFRAGGGRDT